MNEKTQAILEQLQALANPANVAGMARFGINSQNILGVAVPVIRQMAKQAGKDHHLAQELWDSAIHEARILASLVDEPKQVTEQQMEAWVKDFDSWDVCDQVCSNLFGRTPLAYQKVVEWSERSEEFVKRAAFALMVTLSTHDKKAPDEAFEPFFPIIIREATDERNFVRKAVNWALRDIGKRNPNLNRRAIEVAHEIQAIKSKAARWIAADALRELTSSKIQARLGLQEGQEGKPV